MAKAVRAQSDGRTAQSYSDRECPAISSSTASLCPSQQQARFEGGVLWRHAVYRASYSKMVLFEWRIMRLILQDAVVVAQQVQLVRASQICRSQRHGEDRLLQRSVAGGISM